MDLVLNLLQLLILKVCISPPSYIIVIIIMITYVIIIGISAIRGQFSSHPYSPRDGSSTKNGPYIR